MTLPPRMHADATWRPIPELPHYEASDTGQVRSLRRERPRVITSVPAPCGYRTIRPTVNGRATSARIGVLVALAFLGPVPPGQRVRHLNGDPLDDHLENLAYGTDDDIRADMVARARREEAAGAPTHCLRGHRFSDSWLNNFGERLCRTCAFDATKMLKDTGKDGGYCLDCDAELPPKFGPGRMRLRCDPCRDARARFVNSERAARHYASGGRYTPRVRIADCQDCGAALPPKHGPGSMPIRCAPCREAHRLTARAEAFAATAARGAAEAERLRAQAAAARVGTPDTPSESSR